MTPGALPRIAVYTRVSSEEQASEGFSLETQRLACLDKLNEEFGENLYLVEVFSDEGVSGRLGLYDDSKPKKPYRPALSRLKERLDRGEFDAVCVYGLDRLSRSYTLLPKLIEEVFGRGEVRFISVREMSIDLATPTGRGLAQLLNANNALVCDIGAQNCRDASLRRRKAGYPIRAPFGWRWKPEKDANGRRGIEPDPERAEVVKFILGEFLAGKGARAIAKELIRRGVKTAQGTDRWHRNQVADILVQPQNYGLVHIGNGEHVQGANYEQRFFDPEDLARVRQLLQERSAQPAEFDLRPQFLLGGRAVCGHCGTPLRGRRGRGRYRVYVCQAEPWRQTPDCLRNSCRAEWVEQEVLEHLRGFLACPEVREHARRQARTLLGQDRDRWQADRRRGERDLQQLQQKSLRWAALLTDGKVTPEEFREYKNELLLQQEAAQARLAELNQQLEQSAEGDRQWARVEQALADLSRLGEELTSEERRQLVQEVMETVRVRRGADGAVEILVKPRFQPEQTVTIPSFRGQRLTKRQMAVLWLRGQGLSRKEAARQLGVKVRAADSLLLAARKRLGAQTVAQAVTQSRELIAPHIKWLDLEGRANRVHRPDGGWPRLTPEETRVLAARAEGLTAARIAERLHMAKNTAYVHLHHMRAKFGAVNDQQLLASAREVGYLAK